MTEQMREQEGAGMKISSCVHARFNLPSARLFSHCYLESIPQIACLPQVSYLPGAYQEGTYRM